MHLDYNNARDRDRTQVLRFWGLRGRAKKVDFTILRMYRMKARIRRMKIRFTSQNNKYTVSISTEISDVSSENAGFKKDFEIIGRAKIKENMNNMRQTEEKSCK